VDLAPDDDGPGKSRSTRKMVSLPSGPGPPTLANTVKKSATGAEVIQVF